MAKILIVDDAIFMRKMLGDILTKNGHEIIGEADNAKDGVECYQKLKPDVVTMDIVMPVIDGISSMEAIKEIKKIDNDAKIIMVSAMGQQEIVKESIQAGAKDFIIKPFEEMNVVNAVDKLLGK